MCLELLSSPGQSVPDRLSPSLAPNTSCRGESEGRMQERRKIEREEQKKKKEEWLQHQKKQKGAKEQGHSKASYGLNPEQEDDSGPSTFTQM